MEGIKPHIDAEQMRTTALDEAEMKASRPKKRIYEIMSAAADQEPTST